MLRSVFKNKILKYVFSRYLTYFIQFINSILIAVYLEPYYLGIWGFILLMNQYFLQLNFGLPNSFITIASSKPDKERVTILFNNSLILAGILSSLFIVIFSLIYFGVIKIGVEYNINNYIILIAIAAVVVNFNSLYVNLYRVYNKLWQIVFSQSMFPILSLLVILFSNTRKKELVGLLLTSYFLSVFIPLLIFVFQSPIPFKIRYNKIVSNEILKRGIYLFLYNASFYFIMIATRSFISNYYSVSNFGLFTFSFTLANSIILLFDSLQFLIFPKLINKFSNSSKSDSFNFIISLRTPYMTITHLLIHTAIMLFPFFVVFFEKYNGAVTSFRLIALTVLILTVIFGFSSFLLAIKKEKEIGLGALGALLLNIVLSFFLCGIFEVSMEKVILATTVTYLLYAGYVVFIGLKAMSVEFNIMKFINLFFPAKYLLPYLFSFICILGKFPDWTFVINLILFLVMNYKSFYTVFELFNKIIKRSDIADI